MSHKTCNAHCGVQLGTHSHEFIVRNNFNHATLVILANKVNRQLCPALGEVKETIREIPSADVFLVNYVFVDLVLDNILGCLSRHNLDDVTHRKVQEYTKLYYEHRGNIEAADSLPIATFVSFDDDLVIDPIALARIKAVLYAIDARVYGRISKYE